MVQPPTLKETKFLLPKPALMQNEVNPQQLVQMVQNNWPQIEALHSVEAKAQVLGKSLPMICKPLNLHIL